MDKIAAIEWVCPLSVGRNISKEYKYFVVLYSGLQSGYTGDVSIIAFDKKQEVKNISLAKLDEIISNDRQIYENAWFGYLGYGLKNQLESLPHDESSWINFPDLWLMKFNYIAVFNHKLRKIEVFGNDDLVDLNLFSNFSEKINKKNDYNDERIVKSVNSNMTNKQYLAKVSEVLEHIKSGDVYQANLTRKFYGSLSDSDEYDHFSMFERLCSLSPAPYSSYLQFDDKAIISSSPERFINISSDGIVDTRPIKGSAQRFDNLKQDEESKLNLENSEKDKAENLMIVDLCRNDISRGCEIGSVKVEKLFHVDSYSTIHHMVSTVTGQKKSNISAAKLLSYCFPPGSMTGAPKIKAMEICSKLEKQKRGVYSGAIGWFGGNGYADFSVVIRTILFERNKYEFQVGGAIVMDSNPISEQHETFTKATAICRLLGISREEMLKL